MTNAVSKRVRHSVKTISLQIVEFERPLDKVTKDVITQKQHHINSAFYLRVQSAIKGATSLDARCYASNSEVILRAIYEEGQEESLNEVTLFIKPIGSLAFTLDEQAKILKAVEEWVKGYPLYRFGQNAKYINGKVAKNSKGFSGSVLGLRGIVYPLNKFRVIFR